MRPTQRRRPANFTIYPHQGFDDSSMPCYGSHPEVTLTALLRGHNLDVRADRAHRLADVAGTVPEDDWHQRRDVFDEANLGIYESRFVP